MSRYDDRSWTTLPPDTAERILAVSVGGLGDAILFSPIIKALRSKYPGARIEFLVASPLALEAFQYAGEINRITLVDMGRCCTLRKIVRLIRFGFRARGSGPFDLGAFATGLNPKLATFLKSIAGIGAILCAPKPPVYATDLLCNVALARCFDENISEKDVFVPSTRECLLEASKVLERHGIYEDGKNIVAVYPSTELGHRPRWDISKLAQVIGLLKEKGFEGKAVIVGSPEEGEEWARIDTDKQADVNLAGKLSILGIASLFRRCRLAVGNDGGLMHVAGGVGCPTVVVMTNTPLSYRPPGRRVRVIHSNLTCCDSVYPMRPKSCKMAQCKDDITVEAVFGACVDIMS